MQNLPLYFLAESISTEKYQLKDKMSDLFSSWQYESSLKNYTFLVCDGDCELNGHLWLDFNKGWTTDSAEWRKSLNITGDDYKNDNYGVRGMIVTGNLTVHGSVINSNMNDGVFLLVLGDLNARNLVAGGAYMQIGRNANIGGVTYGHYNDGSISIVGALSTPVFINEDHNFNYGSLKNNQVNLDDMRYKEGNDFWDEKDDEYVIPAKLKGLIGSDILVKDDILETLSRGGEVLKALGATSTTKDANYWHALVEKDAYNIAKVPKAERTDALCRVAVAKNGRVLRDIPTKLRTKEICEIAVKNNGYALEYVPKKLLTKAICEIAIKQGGELRYVPAALIDIDMALHAVMNDKQALYYVPPALINRLILEKNLEHAGKDFNDLQYYFNTPRDFTAEDVVLKVASKSFENFSQIPAMYVSEQVFKHAQSLYGSHPDWQKLCQAHSKAAIGGNLSDAELKAMIDGDDIKNMQDAIIELRDNALDIVWACNIDSAYILHLIKICAMKADWGDSFGFHGASRVSYHLMTDAVIEGMLQSSTTYISYIPHHKITEQMCLRVVRDWYTTLSSIPEMHRTLIVCKEALSLCKAQNDYLIDDVMAAIPKSILKEIT